jgi:alkaline phosphatase D
MKLPTAALFAVVCVAFRWQAVAQDRVVLPAELTGPMVGSVTPGEATIWMAADGDPEIVLEYRSTADPAERLQAVRPKPDPAEHNAIKARLTGLKPDTRYTYEVSVAGKRDPVWNGQFTTPVADSKSSRFRVAVTSCMEYGDFPVQPSWYLLLAEKPQLQLLLGDNVYANTTDREKLWAMHRVQRRVVGFAAVLRNVPTYAMWDDHDYGPNNSDGTAPGKENSLRAFKELFANPGAGTAETPGAFYRFHWGDVEFFMLDGRYHRSPDEAPNDDRKRMLGDEQMKWLADGLRDSKARFKVLASGSTLMASHDDGWRIYDFDRKRLYQAIMGQKISGVIYLSGDIHRCVLDVRPASETGGYPLYEVTSSGVANSKTEGFAILEFDTTVADPTIRIKIIHGDATTRQDRTLKLSELQTP